MKTFVQLISFFPRMSISLTFENLPKLGGGHYVMWQSWLKPGQYRAKRDIEDRLPRTASTTVIIIENTNRKRFEVP